MVGIGSRDMQAYARPLLSLKLSEFTAEDAEALATWAAAHEGGFEVFFHAFDGTPIEKTAQLIMRTLPVCRERKISYATFSIVDISAQSRVHIIEYGNPSFVLFRGGDSVGDPLPGSSERTKAMLVESMKSWERITKLTRIEPQ